MTRGLERRQQTGDLHFVTFSCHHRNPYLHIPPARDLFEQALERIRLRYRFIISGYVIMPEHVHLLMGEPEEVLLSTALQALKLSIAKQSSESPFWQPRYYDFNVFTERKRIEKLRYMHRNPIKRGLVQRPNDWRWSSFRYYSTGETGVVQIESLPPPPLSNQKQPPGAPGSRS